MTACIIDFQQPDPLYLLMLAIFVFICSAVCYHNSCYFFLSMQGGPQGSQNHNNLLEAKL